MGRIVPEYHDIGLRELIVRNYRVLYKVTPGVVTIIGVIHGARDLKSAMRGRKL